MYTGVYNSKLNLNMEITKIKQIRQRDKIKIHLRHLSTLDWFTIKNLHNYPHNVLLL